MDFQGACKSPTSNFVSLPAPVPQVQVRDQRFWLVDLDYEMASNLLAQYVHCFAKEWLALTT